jgi:N-dimethylarginine dimethylaminohydrolase
MNKRIVMCSPDYFDVLYELPTNRWMNKDIRPNKELAHKQWQALHDAFIEEGAEVFLMPPAKNFPDMTFVANAGLFWRNVFIVSNFAHPQRRGESKYAASFAEQLPFVKYVEFLPKGAFFEGQGDALWVTGRHQLFIGYGPRTNIEGVKAVEKILKSYDKKVEVIPLAMKRKYQYKVNDKIFYHLDLCLLYLHHANTFIYNPSAFRYRKEDVSATFLRLAANCGRVITSGCENALNFLCNSVIVDDRTIFIPKADIKMTESFTAILRDCGYDRIVSFDMSEFTKAGGAVKCLTLEV